MSKLRNVSICLTDLKELIKEGHSGITKGKNNYKLYVSLEIWDKDEKDQYGQDVSVKIKSTKEKSEEEKVKFGNKRYLGNGWIIKLNAGEQEEITPIQLKDIADDLPF